MSPERISAIKDFIARTGAITGSLSEGSYLLGDEKGKIRVTITKQDTPDWKYSPRGGRVRVSTDGEEIQVRPALFHQPDYIIFFWLAWSGFRYGDNEPDSDIAADRSALILTIKEYPSFSAKKFGKDFLSVISRAQTEESMSRIQIMIKNLKELGFDVYHNRVGKIFIEASLHLLASILFIGGWVISVLIVGWITTPLLAYFPNYQSQVIISMIIVWGFLFVELLVQVYRIEKSWNLFLNTKEKENG